MLIYSGNLGFIPLPVNSLLGGQVWAKKSIQGHYNTGIGCMTGQLGILGKNSIQVVRSPLIYGGAIDDNLPGIVKIAASLLHTGCISFSHPLGLVYFSNRGGLFDSLVIHQKLDLL